MLAGILMRFGVDAFAVARSTISGAPWLVVLDAEREVLTTRDQLVQARRPIPLRRWSTCTVR